MNCCPFLSLALQRLLAQGCYCFALSMVSLQPRGLSPNLYLPCSHKCLEYRPSRQSPWGNDADPGPVTKAAKDCLCSLGPLSLRYKAGQSVTPGPILDPSSTRGSGKGFSSFCHLKMKKQSLYQPTHLRSSFTPGSPSICLVVDFFPFFSISRTRVHKSPLCQDRHYLDVQRQASLGNSLATWDSTRFRLYTNLSANNTLSSQHCHYLQAHARIPPSEQCT